MKFKFLVCSLLICFCVNIFADGLLRICVRNNRDAVSENGSKLKIRVDGITLSDGQNFIIDGLMPNAALPVSVQHCNLLMQCVWHERGLYTVVSTGGNIKEKTINGGRTLFFQDGPHGVTISDSPWKCGH